MAESSILLVDDDPKNMRIYSRNLGEEYTFDHVESAESALDHLASNPSVDLLITDVKMPGMTGLELLKKVKETYDIPVIVISGHATVDMAVEAMKNGARDFVVKPIDYEEFKDQIDRVFSEVREETEGEATLRTVDVPESNNRLITLNDRMKQVLKIVEKVCDYQTNVLISGETGTGKELIARVTHFTGEFSDKPFVSVNCAALPDNLLESELFGYEEGAFTNATKDKKGKVEVAEGGTLFLDEISEMSENLQAKLLRLVQDQEIQPLGAERTKNVSVRIIAATNKDLEEEVKKGQFREDLYYRLNVVPIQLPPLKDRREDIQPLAEYFVEKMGSKFDSPVGLSEEAIEKLRSYDWPGNVRELENTIERAVIMNEGETIGPDQLDLDGQAEKADQVVDLEPYQTGSLPTLEEAEKKLIKKAYDVTGGNKSEMAEILGVHRTTLYRKIEELGLEDSGNLAAN